MKYHIEGLMHDESMTELVWHRFGTTLIRDYASGFEAGLSVFLKRVRVVKEEIKK